jgi:hypothetical protein
MKPEKAESLDAAPDLDEPESADPNPRYGEKSGFRKVTMTLPQWAYQLLIQESARRKIAGVPNQLLSALLREALADYLKKLREQSL